MAREVVSWHFSREQCYVGLGAFSADFPRVLAPAVAAASLKLAVLLTDLMLASRPLEMSGALACLSLRGTAPGARRQF